MKIIDVGFSNGVAVFALGIISVCKISYNIFVKNKTYESLGYSSCIFYVQFIFLLALYVLQSTLLNSTKLTWMIGVYNAYDDELFVLLNFLIIPWGIINVICFNRYILNFNNSWRTSRPMEKLSQIKNKIWTSIISEEMVILWTIYYGWKEIFYRLMD